jgi:anti-anti-sigma regulatory factor
MKLDGDRTYELTVARLSATAHVATVSGSIEGLIDLSEILSPLADRAGSTVIVDLCGAAFVDPRGLAGLGSLADRLVARGGELVIASSDPRLRKHFGLKGLLAPLRMESSLAKAVESSVGPPSL